MSWGRQRRTHHAHGQAELEGDAAVVNVGIGKACTAAIYRRPSRDFEDQIKAGRVAALALADSTPLQGGVPVKFEGKVIGAIGVRTRV